jgi:hypothetical protein
MADPLSIRYNNPGAIEYKPWQAQYGATLGPNGRYAQFPDKESGYKAMEHLLGTYRSKHGLNTITGVINRWANPNVDNNSTGSYIAHVAKSLGVSPDSPLDPAQTGRLAEAMAHYEAGRPVPRGAMAPADPEMPGLMPGAPRVASPVSPMSAAPAGAAPAMTTPYNGPSPDDVAQKRRMAQMLMQEASSATPVGHWTQALARVLQGGVGGMYQSQAKQGEQQGTQAMVQALSGGQMNPAAMVANPWTRQFGMELAKTQFSQNTPMAQAQLAAAQGDERRAAELHPEKLEATRAAARASRYQQFDPDKPVARIGKDSSLEWIAPPGGDGASPAAVKNEGELRKEFTAQPQVKEYQTVRNAFQNVKSASKDPSAAGDLSMIFAYMKILDPNSVVREQEFANAQNAAGVPDRIRNVYNRIMSGERLNPEQRKDFLAQAEKLHGTSLRQYESVRRQYGEIAKKAKARPDQVLIDFSEVTENQEAPQQGAAAPPAGAPHSPKPRSRPPARRRSRPMRSSGYAPTRRRRNAECSMRCSAPAPPPVLSL